MAASNLKINALRGQNISLLPLITLAAIISVHVRQRHSSRHPVENHPRSPDTQITYTGAQRLRDNLCSYLSICVLVISLLFT